MRKDNFFKGFIDTHAHLSIIKQNWKDILTNPEFGGIIDIGTDANDLKPRIDALSNFEKVAFSAGIWASAEAIAKRKDNIIILEKNIEKAPKNRLVAIGECGIDRHHNRSNADLKGERELFELQLDLAKRLKLPIIVHSREAFQETLEIISNYPEIQGVIHCFSYGQSEARAFLNLGYYISFAGVLTYKNAEALRTACAFTPLDRILLETDSPYLAPVPFRGKPAQPSMVVETYKRACELLKINLEDLKNRIAENTSCLFPTLLKQDIVEQV